MASADYYVQPAPGPVFIPGHARRRFYVVGGFAAPEVPTSAVLSGIEVTLSWPEAVIDSPELRSPGSYVIENPDGTGALHVASVVYGGSSVTLSLDGELADGESYAVSVIAGKVRTAANGYAVSSDPQTLLGTSTPPQLISAQPVSDTVVKAVFSKPVRAVSAGNADDALNPANYSIPGLTVISAARVNASTVALTTSAQTNGTVYDLSASGIKDLAGNVVAGGPVSFGGGLPVLPEVQTVASVDDRTIRVTFTGGLLVDNRLYEPSRYLVKPLVGYSEPKYVLSVTPGPGTSPTYVNLLLREKLVRNAEYAVGIDRIHDAYGREITR